MKLPSVNTKLAIASAVIILGGAAGTAALISQPTSATDITPTEQQVDKNTQELSNHETRITNTENDVKDLQSKTNTAPSSSDTTVPATQPAVSAPTPVIVSSYGIVTITETEKQCILHYSDGTNYSWHWMENGQTSGVCDDSLIGQTKSN